MAFLLNHGVNYGEFYERLRDLLQNNHSVSKYKFGNKLNGAMKEFDFFLQNTVKKYIDAFNAITIIKAENEQLKLLLDKMKKELRQSNCEQEFLRLQLEEKDAIFQQLTIRQEKLRQLFQYSLKDNPVFMHAKRLKFQAVQLKEENLKLRSTLETEKSRNSEKEAEMLLQISELQEKVSQLFQNQTKIEAKHAKELKLLEESLTKKLSQQRHSLLETQMKQELIWSKEMQALLKVKQCWRQKYFDQVGFIALTQDIEDRRSIKN